jgi:Leucine-rich repeat (LRR) protein
MSPCLSLICMLGVAIPSQSYRSSTEAIQNGKIKLSLPIKDSNRYCEINLLIRKLGSDSFWEREEASKRLNTIGDEALQILLQMEQSRDLEVKKRTSELIAKIRKRGRGRAISEIKKIAGPEGVKIFSGPPDVFVDRLEEVPDEMGYVCRIDLSGRILKDKDLAHLAYLNELESLNLADTAITDSGLAYIAALHNLRSLCLSNACVTNRGLEHIAKLRQLSCLNLDGTQVDDDGIRKIKGLDKLIMLTLIGTKISDISLSYIGRYSHMEFLDLSKTNITKNGLARLKNLRRLTTLLLSDTSITELDLKPLQVLPKLDLSRVAKELSANRAESGNK